MKEQTKKSPLSLGTELTRNQQKKVLGGALCTCSGRKCANSPAMNCTTYPISPGYCAGVWPASGGTIINCTYSCQCPFT
jgi:hypothetical protein